MIAQYFSFSFLEEPDDAVVVTANNNNDNNGNSNRQGRLFTNDANTNNNIASGLLGKYLFVSFISKYYHRI